MRVTFPKGLKHVPFTCMYGKQVHSLRVLTPSMTPSIDTEHQTETRPTETLTMTRQGTLADRGAGPGGSERAAEEKRRGIAETERHNTYKDFQGKLEKETEKVCLPTVGTESWATSCSSLTDCTTHRSLCACAGFSLV